MNILKYNNIIIAFVVRYWLRIMTVVLMGGGLVLSSCVDDWLAEKRDISLAVPSSLQDLRALLSNSNVFQYEPRGFALALCDDYYVTDEVLASLDEVSRNTYTWHYEGLYGDWTYVPDWDDNYHQVFIANVILEVLEGLSHDSDEAVEYDDVRGSALLFRARAFYNLAQLFCPPYEEGSTMPGIPLRLSSDVEAPVERATVAETYERVLRDLEDAVPLLRVTPTFKMDPSRPAAYGLLARCHLSMGDYAMALSYADSCLQLYDVLIDYNDIDGSKTYPFAMFNDEVILHSIAYPTYPLVSVSRGNLDTLLLTSYDMEDLRRDLYVRSYSDGRRTFRGAYTGSSSRFGGLAVDEVYLIRAECYARLGEVTEALQDLNTLLGKRYAAGAFVPVAVATADEAVALVLEERRKELLFRGLRWTDLRRLNEEEAHAVTLSRKVDGTVYSLTPQDTRYTIPIPGYIIEQSGIPQNDLP